ncbi:MAG: S8 family serine peptidase [Polyangiaceae bacterium]|nr:S8 family serine peptidase [Polyangiaceae bacterium]
MITGKRKTIVLGSCLVAVGLLSCSADQGTEVVARSTSAVSEGDEVVWEEHINHKSGRLTQQKVLGADRVIRGRIIDENGQEFIGDLDEGKKSPVETETLNAVVSAAQRDARLPLVFSLRDAVPDDGGISVFGRGMHGGLESLEEGIFINNVPVTTDDLRVISEIEERHMVDVQRERSAVRREAYLEIHRREGWSVDQQELDWFSDGSGGFVRDVAAGDIAALVQRNEDILGGLGLYTETEDTSLASAMAASSADPGAKQLPNSQGNGIGVWLTEEGCASTGHVTQYTPLAGSNTPHSRNTIAILRAVSPSCWIYCKGPTVLPTSAELKEGLFSPIFGSPRVYMVSVSGRLGLDDYHYDTFDRDYDDFVYNKNVLVVKSAGKDGNSAVVDSPGRGLNVLTVGNYQDSNNTVHSNSNGQNPLNTKNKKPEIVAPGTLINAGGEIFTGSSQATPHAAGLLADLQEAASWFRLRPQLLKAHAIAAARDVMSGGKPAGEGGLDYLWAYQYRSQVYWWSGTNGDFATWAANDDDPSSPTLDVDVAFYPNSSTIRAVVAWLTRGTYTYDHRNNSSPIGTDFDLVAYNPDGTVAKSSASANNPYEMVEFKAQQFGVYRFSISRYANRDVSAKTVIALAFTR